MIMPQYFILTLTTSEKIFKNENHEFGLIFVLLNSRWRFDLVAQQETIPENSFVIEYLIKMINNHQLVFRFPFGQSVIPD